MTRLDFGCAIAHLNAADPKCVAKDHKCGGTRQRLPLWPMTV
jgi:hypothetical protein